ncbi:Gfo/Idh/MocA family protein [Aquimarina sp. I32.4]|uniref:Gfo/Idh/MocA family protein n=1 Tax=Aquimarina sp. I32.4 TaxID=2053903 RepID=UPI000CDEFBFB|nr:Gfo/Idh/MocA family oxidoreductase [Aquimarina sp. I32.4]
MKKLKVGIVGLGEQMGDNILPSVLLSSYARITAICDIDTDRLKSFQEKYSIRYTYHSYKQMIDNIDLDVIIICSYPDVHFEVARYAILKNIAVFVEKPPTRTTKQLKELIYLAEKMEIKTGVGMNFSYTYSNEVSHKIMQEGNFGELSYISIEHISSKPREPFWNYDSVIESFLLAQLIHPLDYLLRFFNKKYSKLEVFCSSSTKPFFIQLMFTSHKGIIGSLLSGTYAQRFQHKIEIISNKGNSIKITDLNKVEISSPEISSPFEMNTKKCSLNLYKSPLKSGFNDSGYQNELDLFFKHILFNEKFSHSFDDMLPVYTTMDTISQQIDNQLINLKSKAALV